MIKMTNVHNPIMIEEISKLKDFGIFYDFFWDAKIEKFKKFNLIYSWNRSGKTTLSRVFSSCEKRSAYDKEKFKQHPENGSIEIKLTNGVTITSKNLINCLLPIRVFNQDFIDDNISFDPLNPSNPIIYVGKEDIESKNQLDKLKHEGIELSKNHEIAKEQLKTKETKKNTFLTDLGREISNLLFDKSYNKTKVESKINKIDIDNPDEKILPDEENIKLDEISKSKEKIKLQEHKEYSFIINYSNNKITEFNILCSHIQEILQKKIISETIGRLKNDHELNTWTKQGYDLHKTRNEFEKCLFCQNSIDNNFLITLSKHFSADYEELQGNITAFIDALKKNKPAKISEQLNDLYPDLRTQYQQCAIGLNNITDKLNQWIDNAINKLEEKHKNPLSTISTLADSDDYFTSYKESLEKLNSIIKKHNEKCDNHAEEVKTAKEKLELHTIAVAIKNDDYKSIEKDYIDAKNNERKLEESIATHNKLTAELEHEISSASKAIKEINKHLEEFFGRNEIQLELSENKKGYVIKRNGGTANNLSESEKTAIAFSYFIVKIHENDFKADEAIIFIDDPISSFDTNFIYHTFSLIKNHFKSVEQLFISTHNFQLFNLIKEWFKGNKYNDKKIKLCGFYMIENYVDLDIRKARITILDKTLESFKSEYHFLFSLLNKFSNEEPSYADFYTIGNIARRFWDIFVDFKIPSSGDQKQKLEILVKEINNDEEIITTINESKVYKILNDFSHNSDPTSAIEHKDKREIREAIKILLEIIEKSDQKHYSILRKATNENHQKI